MKKLLTLFLMLIINVSTLQAQCENQFYVQKTYPAWSAAAIAVFSQKQFDQLPEHQRVQLILDNRLVKVPTISDKNAYEYWSITFRIENVFTLKDIECERYALEADYDNLLKLSGSSVTISQVIPFVSSINTIRYDLTNTKNNNDILCKFLKGNPNKDGYNMGNGHTIQFRYKILDNEQFETTPMLTLIPNPSKDFFSLNYPEKIEFKIFDVVGREVLSGVSHDENWVINHNLPSGIYQVRAGNSSKKLVVE